MIQVDNPARINLNAGDRVGRFALEARQFLLRHAWCSEVVDVQLGVDYGGIVFLAEIRSTRLEVEPQIWVVSGDLPLSYVDILSSTDPVDVLALYCSGLSEWIDCIAENRDTSGCMVVTNHVSLKDLHTKEEALNTIPVLLETCERLSGDAVKFGSLQDIAQKEIKRVMSRCRHIMASIGKATP